MYIFLEFRNFSRTHTFFLNIFIDAKFHYTYKNEIFQEFFFIKLLKTLKIFVKYGPSKNSERFKNLIYFREVYYLNRKYIEDE